MKNHLEMFLILCANLFPSDFSMKKYHIIPLGKHWVDWKNQVNWPWRQLSSWAFWLLIMIILMKMIKSKISQHSNRMISIIQDTPLNCHVQSIWYGAMRQSTARRAPTLMWWQTNDKRNQCTSVYGVYCELVLCLCFAECNVLWCVFAIQFFYWECQHLGTR